MSEKWRPFCLGINMLSGLQLAMKHHQHYTKSRWGLLWLLLVVYFSVKIRICESIKYFWTLRYLAEFTTVRLLRHLSNMKVKHNTKSGFPRFRKMNKLCISKRCLFVIHTALFLQLTHVSFLDPEHIFALNHLIIISSEVLILILF